METGQAQKIPSRNIACRCVILVVSLLFLQPAFGSGLNNANSRQLLQWQSLPKLPEVLGGLVVIGGALITTQLDSILQ